MRLEKDPRAFAAGPRVGEPRAGGSGSCPRGQDSSGGGGELSLQDGSARPTAALPGRRQACGRRERQGAGARLGVPDGGGRRGWGRGDQGRLWLQIRGGGESDREAGRRLPPTTPVSSPRRSVHPAGRAPAVRGTRVTAPRPLAAQVRAPHPRSPSSPRHCRGVAGTRAGSGRPRFPASSSEPPPARPASARRGSGATGPHVRAGRLRAGAGRVRDGGGQARQRRGCPAGCLRLRLPPPTGLAP